MKYIKKEWQGCKIKKIIKRFLLWLAEKIYKHYGKYADVELSKLVKVQGMFYRVDMIEFSLKEAKITAKIPE